MVLPLLQTALRAIYPPECISCRVPVESEFGLCSCCWSQTPFIGGAVCDVCGVPQIGRPHEGIICDQCQVHRREWDRGRAALSYADKGRDLVLALKHGDRQDIAKPAAQWMARAAEPLIRQDILIAPVPLHWRRLAKRRYNQAALLAQEIAERLNKPYCPDLLQRHRATESLEGKDAAERSQTLANTIRVNPRRKARVAGGRPVLIVDDVLTTGATLNACAKALKSSRAGEVSVIVLARAAKTP